MFNLNLVDLPVLERIDGEIRQYRTPHGLLYPSVTTVLGAAADKSGLDAWRKAVGEEEANRISARAARRGTAVHSLCEKLVLNEDVNTRSEMPVNVHMYRQLERELRAHCDDVRGSELFLYSDKLKVAGACDLIASWDGVPSIIDFKTSGKNKRKPKQKKKILYNFSFVSIFTVYMTYVLMSFVMKRPTMHFIRIY